MYNTKADFLGEISTPQAQKANAEIDAILKFLVRFGLPISLPDGPSSPSSRRRTPTERIIRHISFLFFQDHDALVKLVDEFKIDFILEQAGTDPVEVLESRLSDLSRLVKDKPKSRTPFNNRLQKAQREAQIPIKSYFPQTMKRHSPENEHKDESSHKQRRCDDSFGRSFTTTSTTSLLAPNGSGNASLRASTAATSFSIHNDADDEPPPSTYGSNFDATHSALLHDMMDGMDSKKVEPSEAIQRTTSYNTIASNLDRPERQDSPHDQLMNELQETAAREYTPSENSSTTTSSGSTHFLVRDLGSEKLMQDNLPQSMEKLPFHLQWSILRVVHDHNGPIDDLNVRLRKNLDKSAPEQICRKWLERYLPATDLQKTEETFYRAKVTLNESDINATSGDDRHLLSFHPHGPSDDALSRLERHFGAQRFLSVTFDIVSRILTTLKIKLQDFEKRFRKFLGSEQDVFGTTFRCFYLEKKKDGDELTYRAHYFATRGPGLNPVTLEELMDWALNIYHPQNLKMPFPKLIARMDLYLSRTAEACVFEPEQVHWCEWGTELVADDTEEATEFNDRRLTFRLPRNNGMPTVMNDGCSLLSPAAARMICERLSIAGNRPCAFQGRINGAKGMWFLSKPYDSSDERVAIHVAPSQRKVHARDADLRSDTAEPGRWAFDIVTFTCMPKPQSLHIDFIPILEDRGVPRNVLVQVINQQMTLDFRNFTDALQDPVELRRWFAGNMSGKEIRNRESSIEWTGGMPDEDLEKAIYLLECGFRPEENAPLADFVFSHLTWWLQDMLQKLKIRLNKSVMPYGVADHKRVLKPGEIFLAFSQPFVDPDTGESWSHLEGDVLVSRQPAMRNSDMQRVRAVYRPELRHIRDVVVFPSRGSIPLAQKLQGGDYDGDTFWLCFDQRIVQHFRNAPAPLDDPKPEKYKIRQNKDTLDDVLRTGKQGNERDFENVIHRLFRMRLNDDQLGRVTVAHKRAAYRYGSLTDRRVNMLADVHDLIIDATKNGYDFGESDCTDLMESIGIPVKLNKPAYEEALDSGLFKSGREKKIKINGKSVLDILVFNHILPQVQTFRDQVQDMLQLKSRQSKNSKHESPDPVLLKPWEDLQQMAETSEIAKLNVKHLRDSLWPLSKEWNANFSTSDDKPFSGARYRTLVTTCYDTFMCISPMTTTTPSSDLSTSLLPRTPDLSTPEGMFHHFLLTRPAEHAPSTWELTRASALYHLRVSGRTKTKFAFTMGGRELGYLKAMSQKREWRVLTKEIHANMKPRTVRRKRMWKGRMISARSGGGSDNEG
ncbi:RNA dependent RNA polymerase-like protein [Elsinoe fawcettii]|nr:RNA dependent RNA polymerase-like protein [Elsinoe fawcettii]